MINRLSLTLALCAITGFAQAPPPAAGRGGFGGPRIKSP
jgi:hypothetical protein